MRKILSRILIGCYVMAAILFVGACNDDVDIQQSYPFSIETMPVPKKLKVGETAEIRCQLHRDGRFEETKYFIRYFQPDGKGELKMDNDTLFLPNDFYPLEKETFRLYYTSESTDQQIIDVYVEDSFGQLVELTFSFNNDNSKEEE
jgi:conjugate transposon